MSSVSRRVKFYFVIFCGEFLATGFLMFFGCMGCNEPQVTATHIALAWGFTVTSVITVFGHITKCHCNPCVTACALLLGLIGPFTALVYFVAEILGAISGFYLVLVMTQDSLLVNTTVNPDSPFCLTALRSTVALPHGMLCEFVATSLLIFAVCSVWDPRNAIWSDSVAIKLGFVVAILVYATGPLTGASLNPARSFAPALLYKKWKHHWVYWVATLGGATVATLIYKFIFLASIEGELRMTKRVSQGSKQGSIVVEASHPQSPMSKIKSAEESPELRVETAFRDDTSFSSNKMP